MADKTNQQLPRRQPDQALRDARPDPPAVHYHRDRWHEHPGGDRRHGHTADATIGMVGKADWHLGPLDAAQRVAALDDRTEQLEDPTQPLAARPPTGDDADPTPATSAHSEAATPGAGDAPETTDVAPGPASVGSGDEAGAGRPLPATMLRHVTFDDTPDDRLAQRTRVRPDGGEAMMTAAMGVLGRPASDDFALRHAEELTRSLKIGETVGEMIVDLDDGRLVSEQHLRVIHRKIRQMAATKGIDLSDGGGWRS